MVVNTTADVKGDLIVDGNTDLQTLEVNGAANFREDVKIFATLQKDTVKTGDEALIEIYKKLRPRRTSISRRCKKPI